MNGYFETGKLKNEPFEGKVIDISASGLLFAYPNSALSTALLPDSELSVKLVAPRRTVSANARIVRRYKDNSQGYFGCRFLDMEPEDLRFLFEFIYGKPFTDTDATFLSGQV
jgi:c-di-GMP-binding flagellar brake protein YcgR